MKLDLRYIKAQRCGFSLLSGRKKNRLVLNEDPKVAIACKQVLSEIAPYPKFFGKQRYVRVHFDDSDMQYLDLNISSLSKRLGISKQEIRKRKAADTLDAFIYLKLKQRIKVKNLESESIPAQTLRDRLEHAFRDGDRPIHQGNEKIAKLGLSSDHFQEILEKETGLHEISCGEKKEKFYLDKTNANPAKHKLYLVSDKIGFGSYGQVFKLIRLDKIAKTKKSIKIPYEYTNRDLRDPTNDVNNESKMVCYINAQKDGAPFKDEGDRLIGIQPKLKNINSKDLISTRRKGTLNRIFKFTLSYKKRVALDLLKGGANLQALRIFHGDIKPGNVLVYRNDEGFLSAEIIDFGGAFKVGDQNAPIHYTSQFSLKRLRSNRNDEKKFFQADLFSLGLTLYCLFVNEENASSIFDRSSDNDSLDESSFKEEVAKRVMSERRMPERMQDVILKMIKVEEGYDFHQAVADWEKAIADI